MNTKDAILTRRSCRRYTSEKVDREKLDQIIEAGRFAPSGGNSQTTHFIVITNKEILDDLAKIVQEEFAKQEISEDLYRSKANAIRKSKEGNYIFHYNAPVLILTANKKDYSNNLADCVCAVENMLIQANDLDLGSCYINQINWLNENERMTKFLKELGLEEDEKVFASLVIGNADTKDQKPPREIQERHGNPVTIIE